jgi:LacI family transcriptional regulator
MPITLRDIATRTGVSPSVVSTVLSGRDNGTFVSKETRRRVMEMASELNYTPVRAGRPRGSKRIRRANGDLVIGVWAPDNDLASHNIVCELQLALELTPEEMLEENSEDSSALNPVGLRLLSTQDLSRLDMLGLSGVVIVGDLNVPRSAAITGVPAVQFGEPELTLRDSLTAHLDSFTAGQDIAAYLWNIGHRKMALIAPESKPRATRHRYQGMLTALNEQNAPAGTLIPAPYDNDSDFDLSISEKAVSIVNKLFPDGKRTADSPTAVVCFDERIASSVMVTLQSKGIKIPADVSLAVFGDTPGGADSVWPTMTCISTPVNEIITEILDNARLRI